MAVEAKVRLLAARLRCPLCLGQLEEDPASTCPGCATAYHATCVAELGVACATLGCAQGPRPPPKRVTVTAELLGARDAAPRAGLVWPLVLTWFLYPLWPVGLAVWGWALARASGRVQRRVPLAVALLASPFVVVPAASALAGLHGYVTGTASLTAPYFADTSVFTGLDPQVRCEVRPDASLGPELGLKVLSDGPYEVVLRGLTAALGPMPGSYQGPIPTSEEAVRLVRGAPSGDPLEVEGPPFRRHISATYLVPLHGGRVEIAVPFELSWRMQGILGIACSRVAWVNERVVLVAAGPAPTEALLVDLTSRRAVALLRLTR